MAKNIFKKIYDCDYERELDEVRDIFGVETLDNYDCKEEKNVMDSYDEYKDSLEY